MMPLESAAMNRLVQRATIPTGTQTISDLAGRRLIFAVLVSATVGMLAAWLANIVFAAGFSLLALLLFVAFLIELPWTAAGFWNSVLGFALAHGARDPIHSSIPIATLARPDDPIVERTALVMTLRNEDPSRAFLRLRTIKASLDATGHGEHFDYFVLSDSTQPDVIAAEEMAMERWRREVPEPGRLMYRRRRTNSGFKAGNIYDFAERWGMAYEFMLPLDADSLMTGKTVLRLVRIMQANPRLGILQSLIVGTPSKSLFTRLFQFGMRHGMRTYTLGSSWWQADCGPFWGHNALVRIAPFLEHCRLPVLDGDPPLGGHILSHDQVEGALMRRGGFEVRVLPEELGSYEDNPPTLSEFLRRNARWCQGNMQYFKLWNLPGLHPTSRFHLLLALELFLGQANMLVFVALAAFLAATWPAEAAFPAGAAIALYFTWLLLHFAPKLLGLMESLMHSARRYGGRLRLMAGGILEIVFTLLIAPVVSYASSMVMLGLLLGHKVGWDGQQRDHYSLSWADAAAKLWPQTVLGSALLLLLAFTAPRTIPWFLPFVAGLVLAIPVAVVTSSPKLGAFAARWKLAAIPEEIDPPVEIAAVQGAFSRF